jgi:hypothetical protein
MPARRGKPAGGWGGTQFESQGPSKGGDGSGVVYPSHDVITGIAQIQDPQHPDRVVSAVLHTTPEQDEWIYQYLHDQVADRGPYDPLYDSCRNYSQE